MTDATGTDEVTRTITEFIRERFLDGDPKGELEMDTPLLSWGVLNSLNTVLLLNHIHDELGVKVPPSRISARDLKSVRTIASVVRELAARPGA
ncbi:MULTISPECIES: acyl carrier protein [unclassified Streptomyces]|uniref:acyl carrier protein n=1 Tax=unclassified Streptomyces TaxID=2593676 RepID=UPI0016619DC2|nr:MULTISPECIES: acyl carrier protein [unclassified Streptomyces]MBD0844692.1 acyl carrier protein [Streptomyces sp. TRM68416]